MRRILMLDHRLSLSEALARIPSIPPQDVTVLGHRELEPEPVLTEPTAYRAKNRAPKPKQSRRK